MGKSDICRLCLCKSEDSTYTKDEEDQLLTQIKDIFGFDVNPDSELICVYCKERVNSFYSYYRSVLDNQFKLQGIGLKPDDTEAGNDQNSSDSECDVKVSAFSEMLKTELTEEEVPLLDRKKSSGKKRKKSRPKEEEVDEEAEKRQKEDERIAKYISFKCMLCPNDSINDLTNWKIHMRRVHDEARPVIVCCDRKLTDRRRILYHIGFHHETEAEFECDKCSKKFKLKAYLLSHMKTHEINTTKNFQCDKCPEKFLYRGHLTKHQLIHMTPEEQALVKFYPCKQCDKEFPSAKNLGSHVRRVHKKLSTFVCHICAKVFSKKERLTSHFLYKHTENPPKHQCEHCGIELANNDTYRYHVKLQHTSAGSYPCSYCGKVNATEVQLKAHIRFTHETERKHQCEYCPKAFKRAVDLTEHLSIHMGGALYDCPTCDRKFNSKSNMQSHVKKCKALGGPTNAEIMMQ
ncbi:zinc finger protein 85-like [Culicoides brevitarsis]|uniref:zinc finger protein 85-like n=1 Tax=Culicoides brevitarsis TaxID=469753 RepID=UPI00307B668F